MPREQESTLERYSATVGILGDGVAVLDSDGFVRSLNPAGERLLGVPASAILGKRLLDVAWRTVNDDGSDRPREEHPALTALRTGRAEHDVRVGLRRASGDVAWIAVTAVPLEVGEDDRPLGVVVSFRDVSRRKAEEMALEASRERLDVIFNETSDFIFLIRVEYRDNAAPRFVYEAVNAAYCRMVHMSESELVGFALEEALPPHRAENAQRVMTEALERGQMSQKGTYDFPQGPIVADLVVRAIDRVNGRATRLLGVGRDTTVLANSEAALRASEERMRTMAESMSEGVVITDLEDRPIYFNDRVVELTGYAREELEGRELGALILTPEERGAVKRRMPDRVAGQSEHYDVQIVRKNGERRWIEIAGSPYRDGTGKIVGTVGVITDITERKSIDELKEQMVGVVSHELRTPLTALSASLKLLEREVPEGDERAGRLVDMAVRSASRMLRLVNDLLDLERIEAAGAALNIESVEGAALVESAIDVVTPLAAEGQIELRADACGGISVRADRERVSQVLVNLVANSIKFSPAGSAITIACAPLGAEVEFVVRDQGRGIPADRLSALFQRFSQVHAEDARRQKGAGLGLAISRAIVQQHGGRIWADSPASGGAEFHFTLPRSDG